ncbi:ribonuclease R [candidate division KSB1 bacterium]|nr:ribonuclease R [candidate division KSB1 bacterium]
MTPKKTDMDLPEAVRYLLARKGGKSLKAKEIARELHLGQDDYLELRKTLRQLVEKGEILRLHKNRFSVPGKASVVAGVLRVNSQGHGTVIRDDGAGEVLVSRKNMGTALHMDHVSVRLFAAVKDQRPEGQVVEILSRGRNRFVGTLRQGRKFAYVVPDDIKIQTDIIISEPDNYSALDGQKVVAVIDTWPEAHLNPEGHIIQVLGFADEPGVDVLSIIHSFELPTTFPAGALEESKSIPGQIPTDELARRLDLRDWLTVTIDPEDAKDFDDAVSLQILKDGRYRLGVHIADVSYYVKTGGAIDQEAEQRGTSVYLVDRVIPMLPEVISNELCSLSQEQDKLCFSVLMDLTPSGELLHYELHESVIRSRRRFSYEEAQALLESKQDDALTRSLQNMYQLSRSLLARRQKRGSIDFESLEVKVELDEQSHPISLHPRQRLDTHRLIEEFMLLANETVARHVGELTSGEAESAHFFVYRVHEKPDRDGIGNLLLLSKTFGFNFEPPKRITPGYFQRISKAFSQHPSSAVLQDALLRTMMKAKYTTENIGHFGLAYKFYTHFTSPIRRYPDLMVHRLLKAYSQEQNGQPYTKNELEEKCKQASQAEVRAQEAERASVKMKQIEFMERHLGDIFDGTICRIVPFGIFVHLPEFLLDGLVHISDLRDDYYLFEEDQHRLVGQYTGNRYKLGEKVRIRVSRVDRNERLIDFILINKNGDKKEKNASNVNKSFVKYKRDHKNKRRGRKS